MRLKHFHSFIAVAEELSFTKAARRLHMAQPPISRHIRDLEADLGVKLLERNSSRVLLTDAGRCFLNEIRIVVQHVSQAVEAVRHVGNGTSGTIRVGIAKGLGDAAGRVVNEFLRRFSEVEVDVRDIASGFQEEAFEDRRIDIGFMRSPVTAPQLVASAPLFEEQFFVVMRKSSPLARHKALRLQQLAKEKILMIDRRISPRIYDRTLSLFQEQGIKPILVPTSTMPYEDAGAVLVDAGKGIYLAVGRNPIHPSFADRVICLPLAEPTAVSEVRIAWRSDEQAKMVLDFVETAKSTFHEEAPGSRNRGSRSREERRQPTKGAGRSQKKR